LAGTPQTTAKSGMSLLTTEFAPTIAPFPIFTPGIIHAFITIQDPSPIKTSLIKISP
tara:strand:- start:299 stop:469 length:171 start_codon:yes stop_codon:yes gene_type:complete